MRDHRYRGPTAELGQPRKRPSSSHPDAGSRRSPARPQSHGIRWPAIRVPPLPAPDSGSQMGADGAVDGSASCREAAATANPACIGAPTVALRRCPRSLAGADGGGGASASGSAYRWEVSSVTMSAADCGCLASATLCPAHTESASNRAVRPRTGERASPGPPGSFAAATRAADNVRRRDTTCSVSGLTSHLGPSYDVGIDSGDRRSQP